MVRHDAYVFTISDHSTFGCSNMKTIATHIVYIFNCIHELIKNGHNFFGSLVRWKEQTNGQTLWAKWSWVWPRGSIGKSDKCLLIKSTELHINEFQGFTNGIEKHGISKIVFCNRPSCSRVWPTGGGGSGSTVGGAKSYCIKISYLVK